MRDQLIKILAHFGRFGTVDSFERAGGNTNLNFFVRTTSGENLLVKIYSRSDDLDQMRLMQRYMTHLQGRRFITATNPVPRAGNDGIYVDDACIATVQYRLTATPLEIPTLEAAAQVGERLACLHRVPIGDLESRANWLEPAFRTHLVAEITESHLDHDDAARVLESVVGLRTDWESLPRVIRHGDLYIDNVLFAKDGRLAYFIDWDETGLGAAVLDLATAIIGFCFPHDRFDVFQYRALMRAYDKVRPLKGPERSALTAAVRYVSVVCMLWRFTQRGRLGEKYKRHWAQGLDTWQAPEF